MADVIPQANKAGEQGAPVTPLPLSNEKQQKGVHKHNCSAMTDVPEGDASHSGTRHETHHANKVPDRTAGRAVQQTRAQKSDRHPDDQSGRRHKGHHKKTKPHRKAQPPGAEGKTPAHPASAAPTPNPRGTVDNKRQFGPHRPFPPHGFSRQAYAAIDLGTNNCRLLIARPEGEHFTVIDAFSRVVKLGEGLAQHGALSQAAMDRAVSALSVCADKLRRRRVILARSVATEACRRASNGAMFIERVRKETGIALDIISTQEEARLAVLGCHVLLEPGIGPAMIFDIGGGSTELVLIESTDTVPRILDWRSVPWGVVSLTEHFRDEGKTALTREQRFSAMKTKVSEGFSNFGKRIGKAREVAADTGPLRLLGTSGTVTTLASLHLELPSYDRHAVDGLIVPTSAMRAINQRLSVLSLNERRKLPCIGKERADMVVAGCAILDSILDLWPAEQLAVADRGIREGILRSLIRAHDRSSPGRAQG